MTEWLTVAGVAAELGFSADWVRDQIDAGHLRARAYAVGERHSYRIAREWLDDFLRRRCSEDSEDRYAMREHE
jgi:excisionase family DNA binding protein